MAYKFFDKKTAAMHERSQTLATRKKFASSGMKNENISGTGLAEELRKIIIRTFKKRKVQSLFIDNIWGIDLAGIQLISKFNKVIRFFLSVIDIFKKHKWFMLLEDKKMYYNYYCVPKNLR